MILKKTKVLFNTKLELREKAGFKLSLINQAGMHEASKYGIQ